MLQLPKMQVRLHLENCVQIWKDMLKLGRCRKDSQGSCLDWRVSVIKRDWIGLVYFPWNEGLRGDMIEVFKVGRLG